MWYDGGKHIHCVKNIVFINGLGYAMFAITGGVGSMHEYTLFQQSDIFLNPNNYFRPGDTQVLLYDSAWSDHDWNGRVITPYKSPPGGALTLAEFRFNSLVRSDRSFIEFFFLRFKGLWESFHWWNTRKCWATYNKQFHCALCLTNIHTFYESRLI